MAASYGTLINSLNMYVDSSAAKHEGDDLRLQLAGQALHVADGQNFMISLTEFSMPQKPTYTVNETNNKVKLLVVKAPKPELVLFLHTSVPISGVSTFMGLRPDC